MSSDLYHKKMLQSLNIPLINKLYFIMLDKLNKLLNPYSVNGLPHKSF